MCAFRLFWTAGDWEGWCTLLLREAGRGNCDVVGLTVVSFILGHLLCVQSLYMYFEVLSTTTSVVPRSLTKGKVDFAGEWGAAAVVTYIHTA